MRGSDMSEFRFDFVIPDEDRAKDCNTGTSPRLSPATLVTPHPSHTHISTPHLPHPHTAQLDEVHVQTFHKELLKLVSPLQCIVTPHPSHLHPSHHHSSNTGVGEGSITLKYVTANLLQALLATNGFNVSKETSEQVLNVRSDNEASVLLKLNSELGPLVGVADSACSDLIPGVYEGGMTVWECAHDLVDYLATELIPLWGLRVLELGCGVGLPGIFSLLCHAKCVHFQDFNREVLTCLTIPSVMASLTQPLEPESDSAALPRTRFFYGDWAEFAAKLKQAGEPPYDIILTSETIYSLDSQPKLLRAIKLLAHPGRGVALVAAKTHYFGVGGSVESFEEMVAEDGHFEVATGRVIEASVPRKILVLRPRRGEGPGGVG